MSIDPKENEALAFFAGCIEKEVGIRYVESNFYQLRSRLIEIVAQADCKDINDLYRISRFGLSPVVKALLLDLATNNETSFYRDKELFRAFSSELLPEFENSGKQDLRIWSAASSTGQEVLTVAMCCEDWIKANAARTYKIYATDYSARVLARCRDGVYSGLEVQRGLPVTKLVEWFEEDIPADGGEKSWRVREGLHKHVNFARQNLLEPFVNKGPFDVIFCRNVLIYFDVDVKKRIIENMAKILAPGGHLILGAAESLLGITDVLSMKKIGNSTVYQKDIDTKKDDKRHSA